MLIKFNESKPAFVIKDPVHVKYQGMKLQFLIGRFGIDLVSSGHAHGGQFRLPFVGGLVAPNQGFFPKYDAGQFIKENTTMIVSRGVGNSIIPFRINNPPEIVVVELKRQ